MFSEYIQGLGFQMLISDYLVVCMLCEMLPYWKRVRSI